MLAFNSSRNGTPALLLHIYGSHPVQLVFVLTFRIVRVDEGTFGTIFVARIPRLAAELGYVTNVNLTFGRRYVYQGEQRSFLSARCAAPAGFPGADLHPREGQLQLRQRSAHQHLAGAQLLGSLGPPKARTFRLLRCPSGLRPCRLRGLLSTSFLPFSSPSLDFFFGFFERFLVFLLVPLRLSFASSTPFSTASFAS